MTDFAAWASKTYPVTMGTDQKPKPLFYCAGDSISGSHVTVEGHVKHIRSCTTGDGAGNVRLVEHVVEWEMSDAYWIEHATRVQEGQQP